MLTRAATGRRLRGLGVANPDDQARGSGTRPLGALYPDVTPRAEHGHTPGLDLAADHGLGVLIAQQAQQHALGGVLRWDTQLEGEEGGSSGARWSSRLAAPAAGRSCVGAKAQLDAVGLADSTGQHVHDPLELVPVLGPFVGHENAQIA
jgi:hypothetical protein